MKLLVCLFVLLQLVATEEETGGILCYDCYKTTSSSKAFWELDRDFTCQNVKRCLPGQVCRSKTKIIEGDTWLINKRCVDPKMCREVDSEKRVAYCCTENLCNKNTRQGTDNVREVPPEEDVLDETKEGTQITKDHVDHLQSQIDHMKLQLVEELRVMANTLVDVLGKMKDNTRLK